MAEFSLVLAPLILLVLCVLQVSVYLHVRNVLTASAAEGARFAANANVADSAGGPRAEQLAASALPDRALEGVTCTGSQAQADGLPIVAVRCHGRVPTVVGLLGDLMPVDVTGRAVSEGA